MAQHPSHRKLTDQLHEWTVDQLAELVRLRPDLARASDIAVLAQIAQTQPSVVDAIANLDLAENRLLQLMVLLRPSVPEHELLAATPPGIGAAKIEPVLARLEARALVWRHNGRVHTCGAVRHLVPTRFGPTLAPLLEHQTKDLLEHALALLRATVEHAGITVPPRRLGPNGPPRKQELIEDIEDLIATPGAVAAVVEAAPAEAHELVETLRERPNARTSTHLHYSRHASSYLTRMPIYWLYERALALPRGQHDERVAMPREVGVALAGGIPVPDLALTPPTLATTPSTASATTTTTAINQDDVDRAASIAGMRTLDRLADLLDLLDAEPIKELSAGGLGATALKKLATGLDLDRETTARLVELAHLSGMLEHTSTYSGRGRSRRHEIHVSASAAGHEWAARSHPVQWRQLVDAWRRSSHEVSLADRKIGDAKPVAAATHQYRYGTSARRNAVLDQLASLPPKRSTDATTLAAATYWHRPHLWLNDDQVTERNTLIGWYLEEAELLGLVAEGRLSSAGAALIAGDDDTAEQRFEEATPEAAAHFTVQADLTVIVVGTLDRDVLTELRLLADVESTGAATTWRISEASVRRALDAGREPDDLLAFLERHADRGVPQPLAYLIKDVARRHGHLLVASAASIVVGEDAGVLSDAISHRRTKRLGLRLIAPTVAICDEPPDKVTEALRTAGFFPAPYDAPAPNGPATTSGSAPASTRSDVDDWYDEVDDFVDRVIGGSNIVALRGGRRGADAGELPEPSREHTRQHQIAAPTEDEAQAIAERLIAAGRTTPPRFGDRT